ncbi:MAG: thiamine pyrophosphate-binding protein [Gemmatimonadota bacterium]|nr:thiamine pyrophosphate-binding protein [Gemmatimonadota bacterium]
MRSVPASGFMRVLTGAGTSHVVGIPDNSSAGLFDALAGHSAIALVRVSREGEAMAVAAGLWLGGARPLVVIQNTGLLESGDALRGTLARMAAPVPILVTARGYGKMSAAGLIPAPRPPRDLLVRPDVDSVALLTEPTLDAWGIPFRRWDGGEVEVLADFLSSVEAGGWPAALIFTGTVTAS